MAEVSREQLYQMLDKVPEGEQKPFLEHLKARGFTLAGSAPQQAPQGPVDRIKSAFMSIPRQASQAMGGGVMGKATELALGALPTAMGANAAAPIPGVQQAQQLPGQAAEAMGKAGMPAPLAAGIALPWAMAADMLPKNVGELALLAAMPEAEKIASKGLEAVKTRIPAAYRQIFGVPEQATKRVLERGPGKVLVGMATPEAREENELRLVQKAQAALINNRKLAGQAVDTATEAVSMSREGDRMFSAYPLAEKLRGQMNKTWPSGAIANSQSQSIRNMFEKDVIAPLEQGAISGRDIIKIRRQMDNMVKFTAGGSGNAAPIDSQASAFIKQASSALRDTINEAYPELGKANAEFTKAATIYGRFRKIFGGQSGAEDNPLGDLQAVQRIRAKFLKSPTWGNVIKEFDKHIAKGEGIVNKLYDSLAAKEFSLDAPAMLSPSSVTMRSAATLGLTSPKVGSALLKGGEAAGLGAPIRPAIKKAAAASVLPILHALQKKREDQ